MILGCCQQRTFTGETGDGHGNNYLVKDCQGSDRDRSESMEDEEGVTRKDLGTIAKSIAAGAEQKSCRASR